MDQMSTQRSMQLLPKTSNELGPLIRADSVGHSMQTQNALNVQLCISLHLVVGMNRNDVRRLHESINNHPDGIILEGSTTGKHATFVSFLYSSISRNINGLYSSSLKPTNVASTNERRAHTFIGYPTNIYDSIFVS
jgi:hypothetical protein